MGDIVENLAERLEPFEEAFEPVDASSISTLEATIGFPLPDNYIRMLRRFGRCMFAGQATVLSSHGKKAGIFTIFGLGGEAGNILRDREVHPDFAARRWLPIADDMFNNRYVLDGNTGSVLFVEYSGAGEAVHVMAPSFDAFISLIQVMPD